MPNSQDIGIDENIPVKTIDHADNTIRLSESQTLLSRNSEISEKPVKQHQILNPFAESGISESLEKRERIEEMRWRFSRVTDIYCKLLIIATLLTTATIFCVTKSPFSISLLSALAYVHRLRSREEKYLFPLAHEDFLLELTKIKKQNSLTHYPHSVLFHHLLGRNHERRPLSNNERKNTL